MEIIGLRAFADNYIWALRANGHVVVVDPGDAGPVITHLEQSGDKLGAVLITHHHHDHAGGLLELIERFAVPAYGPAVEQIPGVTHQVRGGESIVVPGINTSFDILDVGGHTRGHVAYYHSKHLFCGDALFVLGCGRLFEGTAQQMADSLQRMASLPRDTKTYCAHEYTHINLPFALSVEPNNPILQERALRLKSNIDAGIPTVPALMGEELDCNPFLRCTVPEVMASARNFRGNELHNPVEVFAALRAWRNDFQAVKN